MLLLLQLLELLLQFRVPSGIHHEWGWPTGAAGLGVCLSAAAPLQQHEHRKTGRMHRQGFQSPGLCLR